ncbi:MAG: hypothetical protein Kow0067_01100 [Coriobacteriia bacterium]
MSDGDGNSPSEPIVWRMRLSLLGDPLLLLDLLRVALISVAAMYVLVALMGLLAEGGPVLLPPIVGVMAFGALAGLFLIAMLLMGNRYEMTFTVGPDGVGWEMGRRERALNRVTVVAGALARSPGTAGAGLLARANERGLLRWRDIHAVRAFPSRRVLSVRNSWRTVVRVHCTPENWEPVRAMIADGLERGSAERNRRDGRG